MSENFADGKSHAADLFDNLTPDGVAVWVDQKLAEATAWRDLAVYLTTSQLADMEDLDQRNSGDRHENNLLRTAKICVEANFSRGHFAEGSK
ncbi:hypothetical protein [Mycobacterium riyadhense]|uniref:hypothetical protein n=1 Tax=Mycobacterium riyadhense TaxID=486698 RepID=UPI00195B43CE|nr:hypothetical protein [Mycobacterium riyadhense]